MTIYQGKSKRKISGARLKPRVGKKKRMLGRSPTETGIGEPVRRELRTRGGNNRQKLLRINKANIVNPETGETNLADIIDVDSNPASREFSRRRIITKGAILETSLGSAKVSNRPGKEGFVNAVLIEAKEEEEEPENDEEE